MQVFNCSQENTYKAAIRWEGAIGGESRVTNSVVHGSMGWHLSIFKSNNVAVTDSTFVGGYAIGVHMDNVRNVTFSRNFVGDIRKRPAY